MFRLYENPINNLRAFAIQTMLKAVPTVVEWMLPFDTFDYL